MSETPFDESTEARLRRLEERLDQLERATTLRNTSLRGGTLTVLEDDLTPRLYIGRLPGSTYGLQLVGDSAETVFKLDSHGWSAPYQSVVMITNAGLSITMNQTSYATNTTSNGSYFGDTFIAGEFLSLGVSYTIAAGSTCAVHLGIEEFGSGVIQTVDESTGLTATGSEYLESAIPAGLLGKWCRVWLRGKRTAGAGACDYRLISPCSIRPS